MKSSVIREVRRLSYADPPRAAAATIFLLVAVAASLFVAWEAYSAAVYYYEEPRYVSDEVYYVDVARKLLDVILGIDIDYWEYSGSVEENYWNLEHPPLAKYIIALFMLICGDTPLCWRLPSIAMGALIPMVLYVSLVRAYGPLLGGFAGAAASIAAAADPVLRSASSVAMLDIYQAFFTVLAIGFALNKRYLLASLFAALAFSSKMSGAAAVAAVALAWASEERGTARKLLGLTAPLLMAVAVLTIIMVPLAIALGTDTVLSETIGALRWHTTSRPTGPPTSDPIGWILNSNTFFYSYGPLPLRAATATMLHVTAFAVAALAIAIESGCVRRLWPGYGHFFYLSTMALYAIIMVLGNTTLYSFYAVQLTPPMASLIGESIVALYWIGGGSRGYGRGSRDFKSSIGSGSS